MEVNNTNVSNVNSNKRNILAGPCYLKLLVNNLVAGSIIGKHGTVINQIESRTGCALKLSPCTHFFPGTQERVLVLSGEQEHISAGFLIVCEKIVEVLDHVDGVNNNATSGVSTTSSHPNSTRITSKIVVPKSAVSAIIGKAGHSVKSLQESSGAKIQISSREEGLNERILTITGSFDQVLNAAQSIAVSVQGDCNLKDHMYVTYNKFAMGGSGGNHHHGNHNNNNLGGLSGGYGGGNMHNMSGQLSGVGGGGGGGGGPLNGYGGGGGGGGNNGGIGGSNAIAAYLHNYHQSLYSQNIHADVLNHPCEIHIQLQDQHVGPVIGKNGCCLSEIISTSGARVQISQKGDVIPGTCERRCTISGNVGAVHSAHIMLLHRLEQAIAHMKMQQHNNNNNNNMNNNNNNISNNNSNNNNVAMIQQIQQQQQAQQQAQQQVQNQNQCMNDINMNHQIMAGGGGTSGHIPVGNTNAIPTGNLAQQYQPYNMPGGMMHQVGAGGFMQNY